MRRGIPFSTPMILAIQNTAFDRYPALPLHNPAGAVKCHTRRKHKEALYHVGDVHPIRESLIRVKHGAVYEAGQSPVMVADVQVPWKWQRDRLPSIFMPNIAVREWVEIIKASPSTLGVMGVMDLVYEGLNVTNAQMNVLYPRGWGAKEEIEEYRYQWKRLWEILNGPGSCRPEVEVMVYRFKRVHEPK